MSVRPSQHLPCIIDGASYREPVPIVIEPESGVASTGPTVLLYALSAYSISFRYRVLVNLKAMEIIHGGMGSLTQFRLGEAKGLGGTLKQRSLNCRFSGSAGVGGGRAGCGSSVICKNRRSEELEKPLLRWSLSNRFKIDGGFGIGSSQRTRNWAVVPGEGEGGASSVVTAEPAVGNGEEEAEEELSTATLLWRTAKLPIYSVALVPLSVGVAAAYWQTGVFNGPRYWLMLWSSFSVMLWLNLSNDAFDAETGVDKNKRESLVNITGSQKGVLWASFAFLFAGLAGLVTGARQAGDMRVSTLLTLAIACGYVYQCPPFRLSYKGLGEPLCFFAFGPFATTAFYLSQAKTSATATLPLTATILGASVIVGLTTTLILFNSHFHQIEGDTAAGKISPLVRMGTERGAAVVQATVIGLYTIVASLTFTRALPLSCALFALLTLPIGKMMVDFVTKNHSNKVLIFVAKYVAVRLHLAFGIALVLGFSLASKMPSLG